MKWLFLVSGFVLCLAGFAFFFSRLSLQVDEIGEQPIPLTFRVVDAEANTVIGGATVRLFADYGDFGLEPRRGVSEGRTAADGKVELVPELTFTSFTSGFKRRGSIRFWNTSFTVNAEGY